MISLPRALDPVTSTGLLDPYCLTGFKILFEGSWKSVQANRYLRSEYSVVRVRFRVRVGRYLERLKADFQLESCCGRLKVGLRQA